MSQVPQIKSRLAAILRPTSATAPSSAPRPTAATICPAARSPLAAIRECGVEHRVRCAPKKLRALSRGWNSVLATVRGVARCLLSGLSAQPCDHPSHWKPRLRVHRVPAQRRCLCFVVCTSSRRS
jgi:hypothetical protein